MASRPVVFLSCNKEDEAAVREIADTLRKRQCKPWLKFADVGFGRQWQNEAEAAIQSCQAAAVFVGESGIGPWERLEMNALLDEAMKRDPIIPVIPVLLPGAPPEEPHLPGFLSQFRWVDLRAGITAEGIDQILWGIKSQKPRSRASAVPITPEERLLDRVKKDWLRDVLDQKVPKARRIDLKLEKRPGEVERPGAAWQEAVDAAPSILTEGKILSLFRDQGCSLLILGDTGSGKTTALLLLARGLILARQSRDEPIPVYLHLSSWSQRRRPLGEWLAEAMGDLYQTKDVAQQSWLPKHRILPLLDGLDEVEAECQADCVTAINDWLQGHGIHGMAVCCHSRVYEQLPQRLQLKTAVVLQPLTEEQIEKYVKSAGPDGEILRATLAGDGGLRELAKTPGLLHLIADDCKEDAGALAGSAGAPLEDRRRRLFGRYVDRKLPDSQLPYPREQILSSLAWLARRMKEHSSSLFQLEQLQPTWLPRPAERWAYFLGSRALAGMLLILPLAALFLRPSLILSGLVAGALVGIFDAGVGLRQGLLRVVLSATAAFPPLFLGARQLGYTNFFFGSLIALLFGLVLGLRSAEREKSHDIQAAEALTWSWGPWKGALRGASAGGLLGVLSWLVFLLGNESLQVLQAVQVTGFLLLAGALVGSLLGGVKVGAIPKKSRPNLGMWLTLKRASFLFLVVFLGFFLTLGAVVLALLWQWPETRSSLPLLSPLFLGLLFGFWTALGFGGLDFLQHFVLRALLRLRGYAPARYVQFLDYAADIGLLHRAGGSYFFYYQPLLEHFASLTSPGTQSSAAALTVTGGEAPRPR
jgi:hypothetical protein